MASHGQPVVVERKMSTTTIATSKFMVTPNDTNCISNDSSTITTNLYSNVNSHATTTTTAIDSPIISSTTRIKPKSSSFLHRDYNRKPILARSQVSMWGDDSIAHNYHLFVHYEEKNHHHAAFKASYRFFSEITSVFIISIDLFFL